MSPTMLPVCYLCVTCMLPVCYLYVTRGDEEPPGAAGSRWESLRVLRSRWLLLGVAGCWHRTPRAVRSRWELLGAARSRWVPLAATRSCHEPMGGTRSHCGHVCRVAPRESGQQTAKLYKHKYQNFSKQTSVYICNAWVFVSMCVCG